MSNTFTVRFTSNALNSPEYIGPFYSEDDAQDYCDARNSSLQLGGIPSSVACYSVVDWLVMRISLLFATLFFGIHIGSNALATVNEYQEQQADRFCEVNPNYCNGKWNITTQFASLTN